MATSRCRAGGGWRAALGLLVALACTRTPHPKPNVLLITLDTTRADHLGAYGDKQAETPNIDSLAKSGVRFDAADSPVPLTLPAHSSILSGVIPPHHGLRNNGAGSFPTNRETLATHLQRAGYRTGAFVGSFVLDHRFGLNRGFHVYDDEVARDPADAASSLEAERRGGKVVDRALAWLDRRDDRPFFAWIHLYDPHAPYDPPEPWHTRFAGRLYDGEIAYTDAQIGRLIDDLDRRGLRENTFVVVVGDHGEALGEHGELTHGLLLYEPTLRVPFIINGPSVQPRVIPDPVSTIDLAPTVAALAGAPLAGGFDGIDLSPALRNGDALPAADLYAETEYPAQFGWSDLTAIRRGNMKLIRAPQPEVYDLARDPWETTNKLENERRLYRAMSVRLDAITSNTVTTPSSGLDEEARAKLASLGYVAPTHANNAVGPRPNPQQMAPLFRQFEQAHLLMSAKKTHEALRIMEDLVRADPNNAVFRATLARAWRQRGNLPRAIELYREAAAQTPNDPEAWYNLAAAFQDAGKQAEAGAAIQEALRRDAKHPEAHNVLGIALIASGKLDEARHEFDQALAIDPRNARALNNLGNVLRASNRLEEAEHAYRRAAALGPHYADPLNGLGVIAVQRDRPREALLLFDRAISLVPDYYEARLNRGIALELTGDRAGAAREYVSLLRDIQSRPQYAVQRNAALQLLSRLRNSP